MKPKQRRLESSRCDVRATLSDLADDGTAIEHKCGNGAPSSPGGLAVGVSEGDDLLTKGHEVGRYGQMSSLATDNLPEASESRSDYIPSMSETIQDRIRARLTALNLSAREASLRSGKGPDLVRKILDRPKANPRGDSLRGLADALQVSEQWLLTGHEEIRHGQLAQLTSVKPEIWRDISNNDVPLLGTAAGSNEGSMSMGLGVIDFVYRPPGIKNASDAFAIYVTGDSMSPEHKHGDLRFAHPHRPIRPGDTVLVEIKTDSTSWEESYIGHFIRRNATEVVIGKLNPPSELKLPAVSVQRLHKVLTTNELFGL
ncbi:S24 family peptidase [Aureimonas sp. Leaf324]|uniref:XRE family transcriptional regulator n=1 Tax=Aureimonas sp. Leaf324 TaxID=1736336 RepID=UPI0012E1242A|nr:S24 family peptidase [Aureimonas sp. Leaf324]